MKKFGIFAACAVSAALCLAMFGCGGGGSQQEADDDVIPSSSATPAATTTPTESTSTTTTTTTDTSSAATSDNPFVTTWQMLSGTVDGEEYSASMLTQANQMGMGVDFVVNADGTFQMVNAGNVLMSGTWTGDASGITLTIDGGGTANCTIKGSIMSYDRPENGDNCKFSKKAA